MEDIVTFSEGSCGKHGHCRIPLEEPDEVMGCSSGSKTRGYSKCGPPKPSKGGCKNGEANGAEPRPSDVQCSVGIGGISHLLPFG